MKTKQIFEEGDLSTIIGIPLIELCEDFPEFAYNNLGFTVEKRIKVITELYYPKAEESKTLYFIGSINEPVIMKNRLLTENEMLDKLNNSKRWYRLCTNKEIEYIYKKIFSWNHQLVSYDKVK